VALVYSPAATGTSTARISHGLQNGGIAPIETRTRTRCWPEALEAGGDRHQGSIGNALDLSRAALFQIRQGLEYTTPPTSTCATAKQTHRGIELAAQGKRHARPDWASR
jgi:iron complex outermembrane receptor protein